MIPTPLDPLFRLLLDIVFNDYSIPVYTNKSMRINTITLLILDPRSCCEYFAALRIEPLYKLYVCVLTAIPERFG